jgi:hypothetical protein
LLAGEPAEYRHYPSYLRGQAGRDRYEVLVAERTVKGHHAVMNRDRHLARIVQQDLAEHVADLGGDLLIGARKTFIRSRRLTMPMRWPAPFTTGSRRLWCAFISRAAALSDASG